MKNYKNKQVKNCFHKKSVLMPEDLTVAFAEEDRQRQLEFEIFNALATAKKLKLEQKNKTDLDKKAIKNPFVAINNSYRQNLAKTHLERGFYKYSGLKKTYYYTTFEYERGENPKHLFACNTYYSHEIKSYDLLYKFFNEDVEETRAAIAKNAPYQHFKTNISANSQRTKKDFFTKNTHLTLIPKNKNGDEFHHSLMIDKDDFDCDHTIFEKIGIIPNWLNVNPTKNNKSLQFGFVFERSYIKKANFNPDFHLQKMGGFVVLELVEKITNLYRFSKSSVFNPRGYRNIQNPSKPCYIYVKAPLGKFERVYKPFPFYRTIDFLKRSEFAKVSGFYGAFDTKKTDFFLNLKRDYIMKNGKFGYRYWIANYKQSFSNEELNILLYYSLKNLLEYIFRADTKSNGRNGKNPFFATPVGAVCWTDQAVYNLFALYEKVYKLHKNVIFDNEENKPLYVVKKPLNSGVLLVSNKNENYVFDENSKNCQFSQIVDKFTFSCVSDYFDACDKFAFVRKISDFAYNLNSEKFNNYNTPAEVSAKVNWVVETAWREAANGNIHCNKKAKTKDGKAFGQYKKINQCKNENNKKSLKIIEENLNNNDDLNDDEIEYIANAVHLTKRTVKAKIKQIKTKKTVKKLGCSVDEKIINLREIQNLKWNEIAEIINKKTKENYNSAQLRQRYNRLKKRAKNKQK